MERSVLTVFLASPGDLEEERRIIKETVERVNKIVRRVDWHIELLGWEDTLPGYSRPQSLINKDVDSCDLLVGMLWQRWGQPTDGYSSGFEEEFTRALNRRRSTGKPEIWLFFKVIDKDRTEDPGEQLSKVLKFKNDQIKSKELLFKEFKDSKEWDKLIHGDLVAYILDIAFKPPAPTMPEQSLVREKAKVSTPSEESYPTELIDLFKKLSSDVAKQGPNKLDFSDRARLFLLTSAWFSEVHSGEILGSHETNIAYRHRSTWKLTPEERKLLVRSTIGDIYSVRPGWYWVKNWEEERLDKVLCGLAINDSETKVRRVAFSLLADTGHRAPREVLEKGLRDKDDEVVLQAIRLLKTSGQTENLNLLKPFINSDKSQLRDAAIAARIELLYIEDPSDAFSELISYGVEIPALLVTTADELNLKVDKELLLQALDRAGPSIRSFVARYLRRAKMLSKEICEKLLRDPHADVRKEGLLGLIGLGEDVSTDRAREISSGPLGVLSREEEVIPLILERRDPKELTPLIGWSDMDGPWAYRVVAVNHFELLESRIRSDLDREFESLRSEFEKKVNSTYGPAGEAVLQRLKDLTKFISANYISAALAGLVKNGKREDVKFARKFLGKTEYGMADHEAIKLIAKFGDSSDAKRLLQFTSTAHGETKQIAAQTALSLSPGMEGVLPEMLNDDDKEIRAVAVHALLDMQKPQSIELAKRLLFSKNEDLRLKGLSVLARRCKRIDLEKILDEYLSKLPYYYNVVTWLDRYLFAPGRYGEFFRNQLIGMLEKEKM